MRQTVARGHWQKNINGGVGAGFLPLIKRLQASFQVQILRIVFEQVSYGLMRLKFFVPDRGWVGGSYHGWTIPVPFARWRSMLFIGLHTSLAQTQFCPSTVGGCVKIENPGSTPRNGIVSPLKPTQRRQPQRKHAYPGSVVLFLGLLFFIQETNRKTFWPFQPQSQPGTKMVNPEPCQEFRRRISAAIYG